MSTNQAVSNCRRGSRILVALELAIALSGAGLFIPDHAARAALYRFTTVAGQPGAWGWEDGRTNTCSFFNPNALAVDGLGNTYVADSLNNLIRVIRADGTVQTLAGRYLPDDGTGHHEPEPGDGWGSAAHFYYPAGLTFNLAGNLVVGDSWHHTLRAVTLDGWVTTWIGQSHDYGYTNGPGHEARLRNPVGVATDAAGNIYLADMDNHLIRKITPEGHVYTAAGRPGQSGATDGPAATARFNHPTGLAFDREGNLYIADSDNSVIRQLTPAGQVSTVAGLAGSPGHADGPRWTARFFNPTGVAVDSAGNVFVTDARNHVIRMITPAGEVSTVGGSPGEGGWADGVGASARFFSPFSLVVTASGDLLIADSGNHVVRRGTPVPPVRLGFRLVDGHPRLQLTGAAGSVGFVQYRAALDDAQGWLDLEYFELTEDSAIIDDPHAPLAAQRFYRVRQ